jgi:hypothetical protein
MIVRIQCGTVRHFTRAEIVELLAWCAFAVVAIAGLLYLALH